MYTGTTSLAACGGHAYGVVLRDGGAGRECDGDLGSGHDHLAAIYAAVDDTPACAGVRAGGAAASPAVAHMSIWMR